MMSEIKWYIDDGHAYASDGTNWYYPVLKHRFPSDDQAKLYDGE